MDFLTYFQLLVYYETGTHLLTSLKKDTTMHIYDHIHEWRCKHRLIKFDIPDKFLTEWFKKSFINKIAKYIAMGGCVTEDQAIYHAQYLDIVYSHSGMLYEMLPDAPKPYSD